MLASPAIESPEMAATASGRNSPSSSVSDARDTNRPFSVIELKKSGPPESRPGEESRTTTAIRTGTPASTPNPARLRRRRKISRSSERRNLVDMLRVRGAAPTSTADIEPLSGQGDEDVLERGTVHPEPDDRHPLVHAGRDDLLRRDVTEQTDCGRVRGPHLAQPELPHDPGSHLGLLGLHGRLRLGSCPHLRHGALHEQPADVHHTYLLEYHRDH